MTDSTATKRPNVCNDCGRSTKGKRCSTCRYRAQEPSECGACGQTRRLLAKGMCATCYSMAWKASNKKPRTCERCGQTFMHARADRTMCSFACSTAKASDARLDSEGWLTYQARVQADKKPPRPKEAPEAKESRRRNARGPLLAAYEDGQHDAFIRAVHARSVTTPDGCWQWRRQSRDGYPVVKMAGRTYQVHRLVLQAKERAPLGSQQSHHICANAICVNPQHLQPATHAENIAEMKARQSYIARITELEDAVRALAPQHPILDRAEYATA